MRTTFALLAVLAGVTTSVNAQQRWQPEIGFQAGYSHVKPAGTGVDDKNTFIMLPGVSTIVPILTYGSLYAIIPWSNKVAVEPTLGFSQFTVFGSATAVRVGARINYAITPKFYGAAGGVVNYLSQGTSGTQLGAQIGLGYRVKLTQSLNGRIEAQWVTTKNSDEVTGPFNAYSVLLGVSTPLSSRAAAPARGSRGAATSNSLWTRAIGVSGGYSQVHLIGTADAVFLTAPGIGGSLGSLNTYAPGPPVLFAIFPVGRKIAIEPGLDIASVDQGGGSALGATVSARLNYAFTRGWYGAFGGQVAAFNPSGGGSSASVFGAGVAWGNRFRLTSNLGGRVELNYLMFPNNSDVGTAANTFSVLFGLMMPLK